MLPALGRPSPAQPGHHALGRRTGDFRAARSEAECLLPAPHVILPSPCEVAALCFRLLGPEPDSPRTPTPSSNHSPFHQQSAAAGPATHRGRAHPTVLRVRARAPSVTSPAVCPAHAPAAVPVGTPPAHSPQVSPVPLTRKAGLPVAGWPLLTWCSDCPCSFLWHELAGVCVARPWLHGHLLRGHFQDHPFPSLVCVTPSPTRLHAGRQLGLPGSNALPQHPNKPWHVGGATTAPWGSSSGR